LDGRRIGDGHEHRNVAIVKDRLDQLVLMV
jgi:hypothetical protein